MAHDDDRPRCWPPSADGPNPDFWKPRPLSQATDDHAKPKIKGIETPEQRKRRLERENDPGNWSYDDIVRKFGAPEPPEDVSEIVGYGQPPKKTRFKPGVSGNPTGRPKKTLNLANQLVALMGRAVKVTDKASGKEKKMSNAEIISHQLVAKAKQGDVKAIDKIYKEIKDHPAMALPHNVDEAENSEKNHLIKKFLEHVNDVAARAYRYRDFEQMLGGQDPLEILKYAPEVQDAHYRRQRNLPDRQAGDPLLIPPDRIKRPGEPID